MSKLIIPLRISSSEYLKWYTGSATSVTGLTQQGVSVNFPASILKPFITHNGVNGVFEIEFDDDNRFIGIRQLQ
jgi:hypothetical protein